jgi:hypothetical protein
VVVKYPAFPPISGYYIALMQLDIQSGDAALFYLLHVSDLHIFNTMDLKHGEYNPWIQLRYLHHLPPERQIRKKGRKGEEGKGRFSIRR